jgi:hypothetical protein
MAAAGEEIPEDMIKGLTNDLRSIIAQYGRIGGDMNDDAIVNFRVGVEAAANAAWDANARRRSLKR